MSNRYLFLLIAITGLVTYLLRAIPLVLLKRPIKNPFFVALLEYMPYALLSAMIFPAVVYATGGTFPAMPPLPSIAGAAVAFVLSIFGVDLAIVALVATIATYLASYL